MIHILLLCIIQMLLYRYVHVTNSNTCMYHVYYWYVTLNRGRVENMRVICTTAVLEARKKKNTDSVQQYSVSFACTYVQQTGVGL